MTGGVHVEKGSAEAYLAGVREALVDLPAPEVTEILDDVATHLADLRTELGEDVDLADRLGPPDAYAAELRSAAGYPAAPPTAPASGTGVGVIAAVGLVGATVSTTLAGLWLFAGVGVGVLWIAVVAALLAVPALVRGGPRATPVATLPAVRRIVAAWPKPDSAAGRVLGFVASLQPAWWLLRAFVAAMLVGLVLGRGGSFEWTVVALTLVFAGTSVWLGYRSRTDRRWLWIVVPLNAFAAALVLTGWPGWASTAGYVSDGSAQYDAPYSYPGLWQDGERQIEDIVPVDAQGSPLTGVYLFDQDGRPIDAVPRCDDPYGRASAEDADAPYPRGRVEFDERTGECERSSAGPFAVPTAPPDVLPPPVADPGTAPAPSDPTPSDQLPSTDPAPPTG